MYPFKNTVPSWRLPATEDRISRKAYDRDLDQDDRQDDRPDLMGNDGYLFVRFTRGREHCVSEGGWPRNPDAAYLIWECKCKGCRPWMKDAKWAKLFHYAWGAKIVSELTSIPVDIMKGVSKEDIIALHKELGDEGDTWEALTWEEGMYQESCDSMSS